jgi:predicted kinase
MQFGKQIIRFDDAVQHDRRSLPSPMMIVVGGLPGAGKTYFALRLSEWLSATYINSDVTRREIEAQGRYAFEDDLIVYEEIAEQAARELRNGKVVIVDATFYREQMREMFRTMAKLLRLKLLFIEIVADEAIIRRRLRDARSPVVADVSVHDFVKSQYERPDAEHLIIESKDGNVSDMLVEALGYISKFAYRS